MATVFDLIGSLIFGGALFLIILTANDTALETQATSHGDMMVQQMLTNVAQLVEGEFRNMGFGVPERKQTILNADTNMISFLSDLDRDGGFIDTLRYSLGPASELPGTQNDQDRFLYRSTNATPRAIVGVVTVFSLKYFTRSGEELSTPVPSDRLTEIHVVEVTMEVQNSYAPYRPTWSVQAGQRDAFYSSSLWQQTRLASQNSRR